MSTPTSTPRTRKNADAPPRKRSARLPRTPKNTTDTPASPSTDDTQAAAATTTPANSTQAKTTRAKTTGRKTTRGRTTTKQSPAAQSVGNSPIAHRPVTSPAKAAASEFDDLEKMAGNAAPLDALLVDAALGSARRLAPDTSTVKLLGALARNPSRTGKHLIDLGAESVRIVMGTSEVTPKRGDRRFSDKGWTQNPFLRRLAQSYVATSKTAEDLVSEADLGWRDSQRSKFLVENLIEALAPSNVPLLNPASAKEAIDTAGMSLVRGGTQLIKDMSSSPRIPEMVDTSEFEVGRNIAVTPGAVVLRTDLFELIQYAPQTELVNEVPLLVVPPTINKYYAIDLAPERSLVEFSVRNGRQIFVISWRNPDARHAKWGLDTYVSAVLSALTAVEKITDAPKTVLGGVCSGGILASITAAYLAQIGELDRLAAFALAVTVLDTHHAGAAAALGDERAAKAAKALSASKGYLDGRALAEVFAWLRPGDLVWNYWVNNYLLGRRPPAFDILFWNADTVRMTAGLHADFVDLSMSNALTKPGSLSVLGVPIDLSKITVDAYVAAGIADHITPWENCYRTTQMLGGRTRFALSSSGHVAALVNPPGNPKSSFRTNDTLPASSAEWLASATTHQGTWWSDIASWLDERGGAMKPAPATLGDEDHPVLAQAPGTYVFDR